MKNYFIPIIVALTIGLMSFNYYDGTPSDKYNLQQEDENIEIPENVSLVLERSCLPCHGPDGSGKARIKWKSEKMSEYSKSKLVSKYIKIFEKVDEGKMPPAKDIKKHPGRTLSAEDKTLLKAWAENAAVRLVDGEE